MSTSTEMQKAFNNIDTNGDGKISATELQSLLRSLGSGSSTEEVAKMMAEIDKDSDGFIDFNEFVEFQSGSQGNSDADFKAAFDVYDKDKDGLISASELQSVLGSIGENVSAEDCVKMIASVDKDGDGHVSFDEFKKMMR